MTGRQPGSRRFFSLKWKALVLTSLVLLVGAGVYSTISYLNLDKQFRSEREQEHWRDIREVGNAFLGSVRRLEQLGSMIPAFAGVQAALLQQSGEGIEDAFDASWPALQLDMDIDVVRFFGSDDKLLVEWETPGRLGPEPAVVRDWVSAASTQDTPVVALDCQIECTLYAVVPSLVNGIDAGVVMLGSSVADLVLQYQRVSGKDIAVLVAGRGPSDSKGEGWIEPWGIRRVAITSGSRTLPLLQALSEAREFEQIGEDLWHAGGRVYDIRPIPLDIPSQMGRTIQVDQDVRVLGINDVTEAVASIGQATRQALTVSIAGWLMLELLLMGILWAPMSRLRRTARNLPLLAEGAFATVRRAIADHAAQGGFRDEIDALDNMAIELSVQLEQLENQVADRNRALSRRMDELSRERDFVQSLLDTAQVLILTQDREGRVLMVNSYGESMSGFDQGNLRGRRFGDLLAADGSVPDLPRHLTELCAGLRGSLRHESVLRCRDGSVRTVTWYHSRLSNRGDDAATVLSVGLDVTERKDAEHRLSWLHDHDALTGLANRDAFQQALAAKLEGRAWHGALIVLDLDQFKYINDTSGHHTGDALLKLVAGLLERRVPEAELICRLGGDEFAMLVPDVGRDQAGRVASQVNRLLGDIEWPADSPVPRVTASLGIALVPDHGSSVGDLMACADLAVFQAKDSGRGHWHVFAEHDRAIERFKRNVFWKSKVEEALANDDFVLYFQPISSVRSSRVSHYEVLLRVRQEGGVAAPGAFIEAAERTGLIHLVDRRVLSRALEQLSTLLAQGWDINFSINLSAHGLSDPDLVGHLESEIQRTGVDPGRVILEITETAAVADFAAARRVMASIKSLGCHFALDDFGVGFSSFYYLKQLPIDFVKIDGSFITQLADNIDDQILVRALTQVAKGFGKQTIAEFVENDETLKLLAEFGIDYAQGHYIGVPQPEYMLFADPIPDRAARPR